MSAGDVIIEVEKLTKIYGLLPVLRGLDFRIFRGEFVALLGTERQRQIERATIVSWLE